MSIAVTDIVKRFGNFTAINGVSLDFPSGQLVALLGPSGCGKTTLLRIIAGLESPDSGQVILDGQDASQRDVRSRQVGFVFQHYALFRHMNVFDNIAFGLRVKPRHQRLSEAEIQRKVRDLLQLVQLESLAERYPSQLSGGQRQRTALARALAVEPKVLMLDEPFGALDAKVRKELRRWLRKLHDELHITSIFVTHDQEEALEVADRIVLMNQGRVEQSGTPTEVYDQPANPFVYNFLGSVNHFHGRVHDNTLQFDQHRLPLDPHSLSQDAQAIAYARPHDLDITRWNPEIALPDSAFPAIVRRILAIGATVRLELERPGLKDPVEAEISRERLRELALGEGEQVLIRPRSVRVFAAEPDFSI